MMRAPVLLLSLLLSAAAQAGTVLKVDAKDSAGKTVPHEVYYAQRGMMRIDQLDAQGSITRIDIVRDGVIWGVNPRERTFTRLDQASVKQFFGGQSSQLDAMLERLPPEQRAKMQARMAQMKQSGGGGEFTFTDTGRSEHAGQYSCRVWSEQHAGQPYAEYCVVPPSSLPAGSDLEASMKKAFATVDQVLSGVPVLARQAERLTRMEKMNGFPVRWHVVSAGGSERENVLSSAEAQSIPEDKFAIPQGFTEKPIGGRESN
jgi:hypothetical protein